MILGMPASTYTFLHALISPIGIGSGFVEPRRLQTARRYLDRISGQWDDTLERLRAFVEG